MNQTTQGNSTTTTTTVSYYTWQSLTSLSICTFGIFTNLINVLVFANPRLKDLIYKYMLIKSINNLIFVILSFLNQFLNSCSSCSWSITYWANVYNIASGLYFQSCMALYRVLIEIVISIYIYSILVNRLWLNRVSYKLVCSILFIISLAFYAQKPFVFQILFNPVTSSYYVWFSDFGLTRTSVIINICQGVIRSTLTVIVLTILDVLNVIKFRQRCNVRYNSRKSVSYSASQSGFNNNTNSSVSLAKSSKGFKNVTKMVVISTFFKVFFETPFAVAVMMNFAGFSLNSPPFYAFYLSSGFLIYISPAFDLFIYFCFNAHYKRVLYRYLGF